MAGREEGRGSAPHRDQACPCEGGAALLWGPVQTSLACSHARPSSHRPYGRRGAPGVR